VTALLRAQPRVRARASRAPGEPLSTIQKAGRQLVCEDDADYSLTPSADAGTAEVVGAGRLM